MMKMRALKYYNNLPVPVKATLCFTICQFLQRGISLVTTPFIARMLETADYGKASTFASWESIGLIMITLSSSHAIMNLCVKFKDLKTIRSSLIGYNLVLSLIWGILLLAFNRIVYRIIGLSYVLIVCLYLFCVFSSIITCWTAFEQYEYSYKIVAAETLLYTFFTCFGALFSIIYISKTAEAKIIPQVISTVVIGLAIIINSFKSENRFFRKDVWWFTFSFCVPLLPHYLSEIVLMSFDRIMIDRMCGASDVAIYSIAYSAGSLITMLTSAINSAFVPYQYHKITNKEYKILAQNTNYIIAFVAFCLCGVMLFGREVVLIFGGKKYIDSISLIIPISLGVFFNYIFQLFARVQEYFEHKYTIVIASISCAALNIVFNYIFINLYGYKAAAYTTFVCYFLFCFLHYLFYKVVCKKYVGQEIYDKKSLVLISVAFIVMALVISAVSTLYILKYIILAIALIITIRQRKKIINFVKTIREK